MGLSDIDYFDPKKSFPWNFTGAKSETLANIKKQAFTDITASSNPDLSSTSFFTIRTHVLATQSSFQTTTASTLATKVVAMTTSITEDKMASAFGGLADGSSSSEESHHKIIIAILMGIFMSISLTIALVLLVFCRKKNSVFMLQKSEHHNSDFELNDINDENNTSDSDADNFESEYEIIKCSTPESKKKKARFKPDDTEYEFITCLPSDDKQHGKNETIRSNSFPNTNQLKNKVCSSKSSKISERSSKVRNTSVKSKTQLKYKYDHSDIHSATQENSIVPLLCSRSPNRTNRCNRSLQTYKRVPKASVTMPCIGKFSENSDTRMNIREQFSLKFSENSDNRMNIREQFSPKFSENTPSFINISDKFSQKFSENSGSCEIISDNNSENLDASKSINDNITSISSKKYDTGLNNSQCFSPNCINHTKFEGKSDTETSNGDKLPTDFKCFHLDCRQTNNSTDVNNYPYKNCSKHIVLQSQTKHSTEKTASNYFHVPFSFDNKHVLGCTKPQMKTNNNTFNYFNSLPCDEGSDVNGSEESQIKTENDNHTLKGRQMLEHKTSALTINSDSKVKDSFSCIVEINHDMQSDIKGKTDEQCV